jgi:ribulose-5-phosphate 4-epimerase/fuculose-1-phosphate aldolase
VDATAWAIHGQIHQRLPQVRVVLHLHPVYTTSVACLATPQILPIDQNTRAILIGSPSIRCTAGWRTPRQKARGWPGCWRINAAC